MIKKPNIIFIFILSLTFSFSEIPLNNSRVLLKHSITNSKTHSQTSAPGFHMYYLWAIRHGDQKRYDGFTYIKSFENMLE